MAEAVRRAAILVVILLAGGCSVATRTRLDWPDAPVQLRDESDRDAAIDQLWVMPLGPERDRARAAIADAVAQRIADALAEGEPVAAERLLGELTALWRADPAAIGSGLARHAALLQSLRARFAKAGTLEPAVQTLIVLAEVVPASRAAHLAELDEILAFADQLAIAEYGPDARRAQPIELLQHTAVALPLPWLVDRYIGQLVERQLAVATLLETQGASMQLVRAHADILATSRRIAIALARAGRAGEIQRQLARLKPGIGATADGRDRELRDAAARFARTPTAAAHLELASRLRTDAQTPDPGAALAVVSAGLARYPNDPELLAAGGDDARELGRTEQAIGLLERALTRASEVDPTAALRLGKLYGDRIARLAGNGRPRAAEGAWRAVAQFIAGAARRHPHRVWQHAAAIAESALGKGLASQGLIDEGRRALTASLERAPSVDALEALTWIDAQVDRFAAAERWARAGLALLGDTTAGDRYRRAKLERFTADALRRAGKPRAAAERYRDSLRAWASLGQDGDLPPVVAAERSLDSGRARWWLGDPNAAVALMRAAVALDPESPPIATGAVAFLVEAGRYRDALDVFHRGLGAPGGHELHKVYMSLWILSEGRRLGEPRDRLAHEYLAARRGALWHELLARAATGQITFAALRAAATTGPQRGELAFYGAVLGLDPEAATARGVRKLLERAVESRAILDAEYDLARAYLAPAPRTGHVQRLATSPR